MAETLLLRDGRAYLAATVLRKRRDTKMGIMGLWYLQVTCGCFGGLTEGLREVVSLVLWTLIFLVRRSWLSS